MGARSAASVFLLLALLGGSGWWVGRLSLDPGSPSSTPSTPLATLAATQPDPADPANEAPVRVGERVEALSSEGWQAATVQSIDAGSARIDYARADLPDETLDLRMLRRALDDAPLPTATIPHAASGDGPRIDLPAGAREDAGGSAVIAADGDYLGCFRDTSDLDLDGHLERSAENTPQRCIATCIGLGFRFAAVQYGESCLCGDRYGRHGSADNCDYACTGDPAQTCGGYSANAVYATGLPSADPH